MNDKKYIGFDILENADLDSVEEIGAEKMNIDKNARDRMLKITMDKYNKESRRPGAAEDYAEKVSGADRYERRKITRFVYAAACSAAAIALVAGGAFALRGGFGKKAPESDKAAAEATTATSETTTNAEIPTTLDGDQNNTPDPDFSEIVDTDSLCTNPYCETRNVSDYEGACKSYIASMEGVKDVKYALEDLNGDGVPEAFLQYGNLGIGGASMLVFDGENYVPANFMSRVSLNDVARKEVEAYTLNICPEKSLVYLDTIDRFSGETFGRVLELGEYNSISTLHEVNGYGYFVNAEPIHPDSDLGTQEDIDRFNAAVSVYNWSDPNYTTYDGEYKEPATSEPAYNGDDAPIFNNPYTDRTDISQEELDAARDRYLESLDKNSAPMWNIEYLSADVNGDNVPELFARYSLQGAGYTKMLVFDGTDYTEANFNGNRWDGEFTQLACDSVFNICPEKNLVYMYENEGFTSAKILELGEKNAIRTLYEFNYSGYYKDGKPVVAHDDNNRFEGYEDFEAAAGTCEWTALEFEVYAEKNEAAIRFEQEHQY